MLTPSHSDSTYIRQTYRWRTIICLVGLSFVVGCGDDMAKVREIESRRQAQLQSTSQQDHLGEVFNLLGNLVELNEAEAKRQITYHLNRWSENRELPAIEPSDMFRGVRDVLPEEKLIERYSKDRFHPDDVYHLRDAYLFKRVAEWVDDTNSDDQLLSEWLAAQESVLSEDEWTQLRTATRLFDWTVRNIAFEPLEPKTPTPPPPTLPFEMTLQGAGYRQTDYRTLWRGIGDSLQRSGVFINLCRQASIPAFVLAVQSTETGRLQPWCVGVLIGKEVYLFEPELSTYIPGPNQVGIATLQQARKDASVLRRLNVPGFFDYPLSRSDVQQCVALLNVLPESVSPRMKLLESGLTGNRRMRIYGDVDQLAERIDEVPGIAGVQLWDIPLLSEIYEEEMIKASQRDPLVGFWYVSKWAVLEAPIGMSQKLALGRWRHLHGQFDNDEEQATQGARTLYLEQRAPEFEIKDLNIDVDLQNAYGVRRDLGVDQETYDRQIAQAQAMMRGGKRTATYWISLIQYDDGRYETAESWFSKRVLNDAQLSFWEPAARYNLARSLERIGTGDQERAIELYKTDGDPQEHGNRIRARLVARAEGSE